MKLKPILLLIFFILFGIFLFFSRKAAHNDLNRVSLHGKLDTIYRYKDYVMLFVDSVEFRIIPTAIGSFEKLDDMAQKGDSIFKKQYSDTLILSHQGQKFLYFSQ